jgi:hypothetical protein
MIENTTKNPRPEWLGGGDPESIERQEAQGQRQLVVSSQLPARGLFPEDAARCGIHVLQPSPGDPLFLDVVLPTGWTLKPTDHAMWSELVDDTGVKRASIFYKAAFYDRDAFIQFEEQ